MNDALNHFVKQYPGVKHELIGYSGGGNIAAILAERRADVRSLRTVAGNLDVAYVNATHHERDAGCRQRHRVLQPSERYHNSTSAVMPIKP